MKLMRGIVEKDKQVWIRGTDIMLWMNGRMCNGDEKDLNVFIPCV